MTSPSPQPAPPLPSNRLRATAAGERPQERLERSGAGSLSDTELLALVLRSGTRGQDVLTLASGLIGEAGSLAGLIAWRNGDYRRFKGIGRVKASQLVTVMEIARRVIGQPGRMAPLLASAEVVADYLQPVASGLEVEKFWTLCLNRKNRLLKRVEVSSGTATSALAHPREVFREAIRESACAVVCAHNHPSGVLLSGKSIRICRIRPQQGRFWRRFPSVEKASDLKDWWIGKRMNRWVGCRGGAAGPAPLRIWSEGTWLTGDASRPKFGRPGRLVTWEKHSNMNHREGGS